MALLYKIQFGNGDYYIGQTLNTLQMRYPHGVASGASSQSVKDACKSGYYIDTLADKLSIDEVNELEELAIAISIDDSHCLNTSPGGGNCRKPRTPITLEHFDGTIMEFAGTLEAARFIGCDPKSVSDVRTGKNYHTYGWHLAGKQTPKGSQKWFTLVSPEGVETLFTSCREAGKFVNASSSQVSAVVRGELKAIKGWHLPSTSKEDLPNRSIKLVNKTTLEERTFSTQREAAEFLSVDDTSISKLKKGKTKSCKGWVLPTN